jgi:leucine-rich repeat protein SHOC2
LKKIYLQHNKIEKLVSGLGRCMELETINCENNVITGVAKRIGELPKLKYFLLANNALKSLPFNPLMTAPGKWAPSAASDLNLYLC